MLGRAKAGKTARIAVSMGTAIAAVAGAVWLGGAPSDPSREAGAARVAGSAGLAVASVAPGRQRAVPARSEPPLPASLSGSMPPRLPRGRRGQLEHTRAVRDFFDYFLAAQREMPAGALDTMVHREIAAQLDGTAAQTEALDLWRRYRAFRDAVTRTAPLQASQQVNGASGGADLDAMQSALAERWSIADRTMGAAWSEPFFGLEWRRARYELARLRVATDPALTDAQKAARLQALADLLPSAERAAAERDAGPRASVAAIAALQTQGLPADELRAAATQALGPEVAERVVRMQKEDLAWRAKYEDYAAQRARIDAMGLAPADHGAQIAQLRERAFATAGERLRAASLDRRAGD